MKKSFERVSTFHETQVPLMITMPVSRIIGAAMPSMPTLSWMPFSPRKPAFSIHGQASTPWNCSPL